MTNIYSPRFQDVSVISTTQNTRVAVDVIIDHFISEKDLKVLYEKYEEGMEKYGWPEIYRYAGNEKAITCEQILEIPIKQFQSVMSKARGKRIWEAAKAHTELG